MNAESNTTKLGIVYSYMRWSSEPQTWGDSERRQERAARDWCQRNNRTLADTRFADKGVSGWRGDNRKSGRLGDLLKVLQPGDTILIEDADRWSRENPLDSLNALRDTVNKGVDIVFLKTGVKVSSSNLNDPSVLIPNFFASFLANAENEKRSYRIREAMKKRQAQIEAGHAVRGTMPCWLKWDEEQGKPVVIEEKAKVVRRLFELSLSGMGVQTIVRKMTGVPCISNSKKARWNNRLVYRILTSKCAIGHCHRENAPSVPGVFPAVISEADYYSSLAKIKARSNFTAPRNYQNNSLFTGLPEGTTPEAMTEITTRQGVECADRMLAAVRRKYPTAYGWFDI
ncbi:MAG: recombinase family protein, partial [Verrucomicrobia bacterium]|nr:recombinase family protein [Verrucomicrobiota bacterium]